MVFFQVVEINDTLMAIERYDWNDSNKKIYLMFLLSAIKPFRIQFSENFSLNYNKAIQVGSNGVIGDSENCFASSPCRFCCFSCVSAQLHVDF